MPTINPNRYPVDYTGTRNTNAVVAEELVFVNAAQRFVILKSAPYFLDTMVLRDVGTGQVVDRTKWKPIFLHSVSTALCPEGKETYLGIVLLDQNVSSALTASYQTVGGPYLTGFENIVAMLNTIYRDTRPIGWPDILDVSEKFNANKHLHSISGTIGWEYMVHYLEQLKLTLYLGDRLRTDEVLQYIDRAVAESDAASGALLATGSAFAQHVAQQNAHNPTKADVGLSLVQNFATATLSQALAGTATNLHVLVSHAKAMIQNQINGGMDAHVATTSGNPHNLDKSDIGLPLLENYAPATSAEITNPVAGQPRYVTNLNLKPYLDTTFQGFQTNINGQLTAFSNLIDAEIVRNNQAVNQLTQSVGEIANALDQTEVAVATAVSAKETALQNLSGIASASDDVRALIDSYVAQAVARARAEGYSSGFADGKASN